MTLATAAPSAQRPWSLAGLAVLVALAAILGAWGFELIGGYVPCKLCLEQRNPYYIGLPLAAVGLLGLRLGWSRVLVATIFTLVAVVFLYGAGLGVYQAGAEWGFWAGPQDCGATRGSTLPTKAGDLLGALSHVKIVSCTEVQFRLIGLSFAGWNVVASGLTALLALGAAARTLRT
jgi:disulfide bond formation protein DsbB